MVDDLQPAVRRNDIDVVGLEPLTLADLRNGALQGAAVLTP